VCEGEWLGFGAGSGIVISDVPGLLEGAHRGLGLGRAFLRHIERCRIIIHVVNGDSPDPVGDLVAINQELALFNPELAVKPQVPLPLQQLQTDTNTNKTKTAIL
jgi:GTP-binding protein